MLGKKALQASAGVTEHHSQNLDEVRAAVAKLAEWFGDRGAAKVVNNINGALITLDENIYAVRSGSVELIAANVSASQTTTWRCWSLKTSSCSLFGKHR